MGTPLTGIAINVHGARARCTIRTGIGKARIRQDKGGIAIKAISAGGTAYDHTRVTFSIRREGTRVIDYFINRASFGLALHQ